MKKEHIPYYISILSLIVSGIAIGVSFYRTEKLSMDYMGVIVGILSLLVTVLLGWNIYTVIDMKGIKKEYEKLKEDVAFAIATTKIDLYATSVTLNKDAIKGLSDRENRGTDELEFHMIVNYLQLILSEIQAGFIDDAFVHREKMLTDTGNRKPQLTSKEIDMIHRLCGFICSECSNKQIDNLSMTDIFNHIDSNRRK